MIDIDINECEENIQVNVENNFFMDKGLSDKITLWILRIFFKLGGSKKFITKRNYFENDNIAHFLGLSKYVDIDSDKLNRDEVIKILKKDHKRLEKRKRFTSNELLTKNIKQLSKLMNLNSYEEQMFEFAILIHSYDILENGAKFLGNINTIQLKKALSVILNIPQDAINTMFKSTSKFSKSALLTFDKGYNNDIKDKLDSVNKEFFDNMMSLDEDITSMLKDSIRSCDTKNNTLSLDDYTHIQKDVDILVPYLQNAVQSNQQGVNILLYGLPGTGKTELSKTLANELDFKLFEVSYITEYDEPLDGRERLKAYKTAQAILSNQNTILMYDEAEDIFESKGGGFFAPPSRQKDKAWINRVLESNTIPTIWITNNIDSIDNAIVRRFDMSIEVPIPPQTQRKKIVKEYSKDLLDNKTIESISNCEDIAPALISSASKVVNQVVNCIETKNSSEVFTHLLNNTLKAQGHQEIKTNLEDSLPSTYNPSFINSDTNLEELATGIKNNPNARLCLYGVAGTGKSAYGKYIAKILEKKVILKKASDLQSMWVGECEKNIANAFKEAKEEKAVLIFDEVDSFLQDRSGAKNSWEISQVNEMLVQMENFDGIFIATTNLMDNLDSASLRRFDLKLEFKYLKPNQSWELFKANAKELKLKISDKSKSKVQNLRHLAPGDFMAVVRQSKFKPIKDTDDFIARLEDEIKVKKVDSGIGKLGFL